MAMRRSPWEAVVIASGLLLLMAWAFRWQRTVRHRQARSAAAESWQHVRERFPTPAKPTQPAEVSAEMLQTLVRKNPFSPQRGGASRVSQERAGSSKPSAPPEPTFLYKGRIVMGATPRAILEEAHTAKTYFLQVGQDVVGFKVLDISEEQVLLSNPKTHDTLTIPLQRSQTRGKDVAR